MLANFDPRAEAEEYSVNIPNRSDRIAKSRAFVKRFFVLECSTLSGRSPMECNLQRASEAQHCGIRMKASGTPEMVCVQDREVSCYTEHGQA